MFHVNHHSIVPMLHEIAIACTQVQKEKLEAYYRMVLKKQEAMNLIAPSTIPIFWERHVADSLVLLPYLENKAGIKRQWVDMGSGAGFPGMVLGIMNQTPMLLIESDGRKARFLQEVAHELGLEHVSIYNGRVEALRGVKADVVMARAVASLDTLWRYALPLLKFHGYGLFLKGVRYKDEINALRTGVKVVVYPNRHSDGVIIKLQRSNTAHVSRETSLIKAKRKR